MKTTFFLLYLCFSAIYSALASDSETFYETNGKKYRIRIKVLDNEAKYYHDEFADGHYISSTEPFFKGQEE